MLKIKATAFINKDYKNALKKGDVVEIDAMKIGISQTGVMLRITNVWKKPAWFDVAWFDGLEK